jgi:hypothetical protein
MKTITPEREKVEGILRSWKGSDAAQQQSPSQVAEEIDDVYVEYIQSLPKRTVMINAGQNDWQRKVA